MPWSLIAAGISGAGSLFGGLLGSNAADTAAQQEQQAASDASTLEQTMFQQTVPYVKPFVTGGKNALAALQQTLGIGPYSTGQAPTNPMLAMLMGAPGGGIDPRTFQGSPGFQFQKQQGIDAVTNAAAGRGGLSGNTLQSLTSFGQGLANTDFYNYLNQLNAAYGQLTGNLSSIVGQGAASGGALAGNTLQTAGLLGSNILGAGNAAAAGTIGSASALSGGLSGLGNAALLYSLTKPTGTDTFLGATNTA